MQAKEKKEKKRELHFFPVAALDEESYDNCLTFWNKVRLKRYK